MFQLSLSLWHIRGCVFYLWSSPLASFRLASFVDNLEYPKLGAHAKTALPPSSLTASPSQLTKGVAFLPSIWPPTNGPALRVAGPTDSSCKGPLGSQSLSSKEEHLKESEGSSMNGESYEKGRAS